MMDSQSRRKKGNRVRLHKAVAAAGLASRRGAEKLIREGRILVNGKPAVGMGVLVDPEKDILKFDGNLLPQRGSRRSYLLCKPKNILCTRRDPQGRRTVFDLFPEELRTGLHTAGRLGLFF